MQNIHKLTYRQLNPATCDQNFVDPNKKNLTSNSKLIEAIPSPPDSKPKVIKVSFAGCPLTDRLLFSSSSCILPISISNAGRKEQDGQKFEATLKLIDRSFKSCTLLVLDSLYRHTLKIEIPDATKDDLYRISRETGDAWLERNEEACRRLSLPYQIRRWDDYLNHSDFPKYYKIVSNLYAEDGPFKEAILATAKQYLYRHTQRNQKFENPEEILGYCVEYLIEECAGMCVYVEGQYDFEVYPAGRTPAIAMTHERLIQPNHPSLLKPVGLRFKKH